MKKTSEIISLLKPIREHMIQKYKVKEIGLFGSTVRHEQAKTSDVDVLVDFKKGADLFDLIGLGQFLEEKLRCKVDLVPKRALRKELKKSVLRELVEV